MLEKTGFAYCQLNTDIVAVGLTMVEAYATLNAPTSEQSVFVKVVESLAHEADVVVRVAKWIKICTPTFLPCGEQTVSEIGSGFTSNTQVPCHKAVVFYSHFVVGIVDRGAIQRIAHHLSPMLPSRENMVVVVIVMTSDVV